MGNVVDRNDAVEQHNDHKEEKAEGEIVQERIGYHIAFSIVLTASADRQAQIASDEQSRVLIDDVIASVHIKSFAGDETRGVVGKKCSCNSDVIDADKAAGRGLALGLFEQLIE